MAVFDLAKHGWPVLELGCLLESWLIPETTAPKSHEQNRHIPIFLVSHRASGYGDRPIDLPIALQLAEENRYIVRIP